VILTSVLVSQTLKISELEDDIRKTFGVGVEFVGVGVDSESEIKDSTYLWCAGARVQKSTPEGVSVFQQEPVQDQEWIFLIRPRAGAGVIFNRVQYVCSVHKLFYRS